MQTNKPQGTTQMTAPKTATTEMIQEPSKKVRIKALKEIDINGVRLKEGEEIEVSEELAQEFCRPFEGGFSFSGERNEDNPPRWKYQRAEIVQ